MTDTKQMASCFKLYPWEWMFRESFGKHLRTSEINGLDTCEVKENLQI